MDGKRFLFSSSPSVNIGNRTVNAGKRLFITGNRTVNTGKLLFITGNRTMNTGRRTMDVGKRTMDCLYLPLIDCCNSIT